MPDDANVTDAITDVRNPLGWIDGALTKLDNEGLRRHLRTVTPLPGGRCLVDGRELVNFATNDYLGLAFDPRIIEAAKRATDESGTGSRASALITGRTPWHAQLEQRLAEFEGTEAALLFPSGYAANVGVIGALVEAGDVVCGDRLNHASLIDGCRLTGATFRVYRHADIDHLDHELHKHTAARRRLIVTDGLFSMDGHIPPLADLCDIAERHHAMLLVDDAHGTGVLGDAGRGTVEACGIEDRVPVRIGTLSKALGSQGGFVVGSWSLIDWVANRARPHIYSTALTPAACAAAMAALDIIDEEPQRRERLRQSASELRGRLQSAGIDVMGDQHSPIVPILVGDVHRTVLLSQQLAADGLLVPAIRPPSVPERTARLRVSLTADHTADDIDRLASHLCQHVPTVR